MLDWKEVNGVWYCYQNGIMVKGWIEDPEKRWYYLNPSDGKMATGWIQIDSRWYYLYTQQTDKDNVTHYKGEMATGWIQIDSKWYYLYTQQTDKDNVTHYKGEMTTGWIQINSKWYYLLTQKTEYNGNTHYTGEMVASTTMTIDNKSYTFDSNGVMQENNNGLVSDNCINFIKGYEIFRPNKYDDGTGTITQGYGCTGSEIADWGDTITEKEASDKLIKLANTSYGQPIKNNLLSNGVSLTQHQFDAIVSFAYNIGLAELLKNSSLYKYVLSGGRDSATIKTYFCLYNKGTINGQVVVMDGLTKRRIAESNIFNYGIYDSTH